jgi:hypothetical protein
MEIVFVQRGVIVLMDIGDGGTQFEGYVQTPGKLNHLLSNFEQLPHWTL